METYRNGKSNKVKLKNIKRQFKNMLGACFNN